MWYSITFYATQFNIYVFSASGSHHGFLTLQNSPPFPEGQESLICSVGRGILTVYIIRLMAMQ